MVDSRSSDAAALALDGVWVEDLRQALDRFTAGESVVVVAETTSGSAAPILELLSDDIAIHSNVVAARAGKSRVGGVADDLELDDFPGTAAVVLEEAQWADPTSLGRLQRLVVTDGAHLLLIVAHRPLSEIDGWWFDQLSADAARHAHLVVARIEDAGAAGRTELGRKGEDLVIATRLVPGPISVPVASRLLDLDEEGVMELGEELTRAGWVRQERGGFRCVAGVSGPAAGDVRTGHMAGRLAEIMDDMGAPAAVVGSLRLASGRPDVAFPLLAEAAADAERRHATGEAFHLAEDALHAAEEAGLAETDQLGRLHLICGRFLRSAGRTDWARHHLDRATSLLEGVALVDALGFAAAVADDGQHPQEAERIIAMAEWQASRLGETAKLGSLLTFRARTLNRLGFAEEADHVLFKGTALLEEGSTPQQRFNASLNKAWIHFDRGEASLAETDFTHLRDEARSLEGDVSVADKEAWRARALFASGHPGEAIEAIGYVEEVAAREDVEAPLFLAQLALTEGSLIFGRYEEALASSGRVLDLVQRQLPAWENMARSYRAEALMRLGRAEEAAAEISAAIAASPPGPDGWRWRIRCQALQMEIAVESGGRWPAREAEDLADLMLQSRLYGWAADLLCAIARHGRRKSAAAEAMAIAVKVGRPMTAARAATIGSLWSEPAAGPVVMAMRAIESEMPPEWADAWLSLHAVRQGLETPEPTVDAETEAATAALEEALRKAGLAGEDMVLSPAQRRSRGLVRRPRVWRPLRLAAAALGVVVLAGGTALAVVTMNSGDEVTVPTSQPPIAQASTVPEPLSLEETPIALPPDTIVNGTVEHRGGAARTGVLESDGLREVSGRYWTFDTGAGIEASIVAWGQNLYVATIDGTVHALNQTSGEQAWPAIPAEGRIFTAPALGQVDFGEGAARPIIVIVDDDGVVRVHRADSGEFWWRIELPGRIRSSPVMDSGVLYVATSSGFVHAFDLVSKQQLWTYPAEGEGLGLTTADLTFRAGVLYVGTEEGMLHVLDVSSGEPLYRCGFDAKGSIAVSPIALDDVVYVATLSEQIFTLPPGVCEGSVPDRLPSYFAEGAVDVAPAVRDDVIYLPVGRFLNSKKLSVQETTGLADPNEGFLWPPSEVTGEVKITAPPVIAGETLYFADETGVVYAVDANTGEALWVWETGSRVQVAPAVVDGVVFIASGDGIIYAVGDGPAVEGEG